MTFGKRLKQLRVANDLTQHDLAEQVNLLFLTKLSKTTISKMESDRQKPTVEMLANFAQFFDVSLDYMYGGNIIGIDADYNEILAIRQEIRDNPDMEILFTTSKRTPKQGEEEEIRVLHVLKRARTSVKEG